MRFKVGDLAIFVQRSETGTGTSPLHKSLGTIVEVTKGVEGCWADYRMIFAITKNTTWGVMDKELKKIHKDNIKIAKVLYGNV